VTRAGAALAFAGKRLRADRSIVLAAVINDGFALEHASSDMRADRAIVHAAIAQTGFALRFASSNLRADRELVVCGKGGCFLQFTSPELQNDRRVVLSAVAQDGYVFQYASESLRGDRELGIIATVNDWRAVQFCSEDLKDDRQFMIDVLAIDFRALQFASERLQSDRNIKLIAKGGFALSCVQSEFGLKRESLRTAAGLGPSSHPEREQHRDWSMEPIGTTRRSLSRESDPTSKDDDAKPNFDLSEFVAPSASSDDCCSLPLSSPSGAGIYGVDISSKELGAMSSPDLAQKLAQRLETCKVELESAFITLSHRGSRGSPTKEGRYMFPWEQRRSVQPSKDLRSSQGGNEPVIFQGDNVRLVTTRFNL
jgi:hypothetical protein